MTSIAPTPSLLLSTTFHTFVLTLLRQAHNSLPPVLSSQSYFSTPWYPHLLLHSLCFLFATHASQDPPSRSLTLLPHSLLLLQCSTTTSIPTRLLPSSFSTPSSSPVGRDQPITPSRGGYMTPQIYGASAVYGTICVLIHI